MHPDDFLALPPPAYTDPGSVTIRWLGTSGYELRCDGHVLLIDPYLSRPCLKTLLLEPLVPDTALIYEEIDRADAILVSHTHFDHALDVPCIARRTGATVYGSKSAAHLTAASGIPTARIEVCDGRREVEIGPFKVTVVPSAHSKLVFGSKVPYPGDIPASCDPPLRALGYRVGEVFSFAIEVGDLCIYHVASAEFVDEEVRHSDVDVLIFSISGRQASERYVERAVKVFRPQIMMPMHYDDFMRPFHARMRLLPFTRFGELVDEIASFDPGVEVRTLRIGGRTAIG